jgi:NDP-sugar pyrophosphorylase family protein
MKIIVPMAGQGSRFSSASRLKPEYRLPKPLIPVFNKPMIRWAIESLPFMDLPNRPSGLSWKIRPASLIFVCLQEHEDNFSMSRKLRDLFGKSINIILIECHTEGAIQTALAAKSIIPDSAEDILISDSDHYFEGENFARKIQSRTPDTAGIIPVDSPKDNTIKHSYSLAVGNDVIKRVAEKDAALARQGAYSNIGAYYFSQAETFFRYAENTVKNKIKTGPPEKAEYYVAPLYQQMINDGLTVRMAYIKNSWRLGTPEDLEYFLINFHKHH